MGYPGRLFPTIFVMVLLLVASGDVGPGFAEARICETPSHRFNGLCVRASNCAVICQTEGFYGGKCRGFRRRCFCVKKC